MLMNSNKREFKAPWKESEQSMHETVATPTHLSQKWMDMFAFGERSRHVLDQESKELQKPSDTLGSQRIASQLLQSLHEKETSSQKGFHGGSKELQTDQIMKRLDDVDQKMQVVLNTIKTISAVLEDINRGKKDAESMNAIIDRVSNAVMAFHAHRTAEDGHHCFGETDLEDQRPRGTRKISREEVQRDVYIKERTRKKFKRDGNMLRVSSQESCSSRK